MDSDSRRFVIISEYLYPSRRADEACYEKGWIGTTPQRVLLWRYTCHQNTTQESTLIYLPSLQESTLIYLPSLFVLTFYSWEPCRDTTLPVPIGISFIFYGQRKKASRGLPHAQRLAPTSG